MTFSPKDTKLLWGRAAGICGNPECRTKVTEIGDSGESFLTGEMAHIIAQSSAGPRGAVDAGSDSYENLILLCPTCHRKIDKSPEGTYTIDMLHIWKTEHEDWVDTPRRLAYCDDATNAEPEFHSPRARCNFIGAWGKENWLVFGSCA